MLSDVINSTDWTGYNTTKLLPLLQQLDSADGNIRKNAVNQISDLIVPWQELEGHGSYLKAQQIIKTQPHVQVVNILIYLLDNDTNADKIDAIQLLHDMYRLGDVQEVYHYSAEQWEPMHQLTSRIRQTVDEAMPLFQELAKSKHEELRQIAQDLVNLIKRYRQ